jgi:putative hydrolase of the HAD superfamily
MVRAVIFDLDDTLISERQYIESGYHHIANLLSNRLNFDEEQLYQYLIELLIESPKNVFNRLFAKLEITYTKDIILELVDEYRNHIPNIEFFDDVFPCLEVLKQKDIKLGIITDGYANAQQQKINAIRAYDHFDEIIITDELGRDYWKPHSKVFEMMREKLNVKFDEMVYVGDNPEKDFYISNKYPIKTVRVRREGVYKDSQYFQDIKEDYTIDTLQDVMDLFKY